MSAPLVKSFKNLFCLHLLFNDHMIDARYTNWGTRVMMMRRAPRDQCAAAQVFKQSPYLMVWWPMGNYVYTQHIATIMAYLFDQRKVRKASETGISRYSTYRSLVCLMRIVMQCRYVGTYLCSYINYFDFCSPLGKYLISAEIRWACFCSSIQVLQFCR